VAGARALAPLVSLWFCACVPNVTCEWCVCPHASARQGGHARYTCPAPPCACPTITHTRRRRRRRRQVGAQRRAPARHAACLGGFAAAVPQAQAAGPQNGQQLRGGRGRGALLLCGGVCCCVLGTPC
jgi:hypothetical protein